MPKTQESVHSFSRGPGTLSEIIRVALRAHALGIRTCIPATVVTFEPATQKALITLGILGARYSDIKNPITGAPEDIPDKPLQITVPVVLPYNSAPGGGGVTYPLVPGTTGHITISDRSLERWMVAGVPADPGLRHTHNEIDGIFTPGLHPNTTPIVPPVSMTHTVLEGALIKIGVGAAQAAVLGTAFLIIYNDLVAKFNAHTHLTTATIGLGPAVGVIASPTTPAQPMVAGTHTSLKVSIQ